jgi:hypothetical protein
MPSRLTNIPEYRPKHLTLATTNDSGQIFAAESEKALGNISGSVGTFDHYE